MSVDMFDRLFYKYNNIVLGFPIAAARGVGELSRHTQLEHRLY